MKRSILGSIALAFVLAFLVRPAVSAAHGPDDYIIVSSFRVELDGQDFGRFESASGIGIDLIDDGGVSGGVFTARDLCLSRGLTKDLFLRDWIRDIKNGRPARKNGSVILLDDKGNEVVRFEFTGAWPKSWSVPKLTKDRNGQSILREEIVFSVQGVRIK